MCIRCEVFAERFVELDVRELLLMRPHAGFWHFESICDRSPMNSLNGNSYASSIIESRHS